MKIKFKTKHGDKITETDILKFAIILMCISAILQSSIVFESWTVIINVLKYTIPILGVLIAFLKQQNKINIYYLIKMFGISIAILSTCILTGDFSYFLIVIIFALSKNITINEFVKISLSVLVLFGGVQILLWMLNACINLGFPVYYNVAERRISFLFTHPNIAAIKLGWGIVMYIWLEWDKLTHMKIAFCWLAIIILYITTKSDSCLILFMYLIMVSLRKISIIKTAIVLFSKYCFLLFGVFNFIVAKLYVYGGHWTRLVRQLDIFFSRRIAMAYLAIQDNGISLIGQRIKQEHEWDLLFNFGNYTIDNLYVYFYVCIGFIYFVFIWIGFYKLGKYKDYKVALIVVIFSLYALIEVHCLYLANCFALLLLKCLIFREKKIE